MARPSRACASAADISNSIEASSLITVDRRVNVISGGLTLADLAGESVDAYALNEALTQAFRHGFTRCGSAHQRRVLQREIGYLAHIVQAVLEAQKAAIAAANDSVFGLGAAEGVWRVGFTKFATRMLGDLVEYSFAVQTQDQVEIGQEIGWIEGFKAVTDIYCVVGGEFVRSNPELEQDITVAESDPYGAGWLYEVQGTERPESVDVNGYVAILDATIDKMLKSRHERGEDD
mgnify:CR=1 FL=1